MSPDLKAIADQAFNYSIAMVGWASALAVFSVQMSDKVISKRDKSAITIIILFCLITILTGMICLSLIIGLNNINDSATANVSNSLESVLDFAQIQFIFFLMALLLNLIHGLSHVWKKKKPSTAIASRRSTGAFTKRSSKYKRTKEKQQCPRR